MVRYGRSYCWYRPEVVVSGRRTPILPVPACTMAERLAMYEKSAVNELTLRSAGTVAAGPEVVVLLPHAAATSASTPAHAVNDSLLRFPNVIWTSCPRRSGASCCLLPGRPGARVRRQTGLLRDVQ